MKEKGKESGGMEAKYSMTVEQNIFVAKRNIVDYIWKSARLEGIGVTFPDTDAIYNGINVPNLKVDDIIAINNLKHAWRFVLENIDYLIDYPFICKINQYVGGGNLIERAGFIRNIPVSIGGTTWKPEMPIESKIKEEIADIQKIENPTERAITLMLHVMRRQMFLDGNKRTCMLAGNQVMIANGVGIISIPIEYHVEFKTLLVDFYESNKADDIKRFVYDKCIDGIAFENSKSEQTHEGDR
jgi:Fic family protein